MPERRGLVIGVNGQDGSYLSEQLLLEGWRIVGLGRQSESRYVPDSDRFTYKKIDLAHDAASFADLLSGLKPTHIFHFAAIHGSAGFQYEPHWQDALAVNVGSVHLCLEYIRTQNTAARLLYASSAKAFGDPLPQSISETTPKKSCCLYSITKNAASDLIDQYRRHHGVRATIAYFFNHESPRRSENYFFPRLLTHLACALKEKARPLPLRSLDFAVDWGSSAEYTKLAQLALELDANEDYVIATGHTWKGVEFVDALFRQWGLDWSKHIQLETSVGSAPVLTYRADISRLIAALGAGPQKSALDVANWILAENHGIKLGEKGSGTSR